MARVLFLPLLQIPSGHHHVADCIQEQLKNTSNSFSFEKVELLSYCYGKAEKLISSLYLQSIHKLPKVYSSIYRTAAWHGQKQKKHFQIYEWLFLRKIRQLMVEKKPDIVICTHAFPSYLLHILKKKKIWSGLVINVYTDYFINKLWGMEAIDYHFVPCIHLKEQLLNRGVKSERIYVTGIPVHPIFKSELIDTTKREQKTIIISGGNMGTGSIRKFLHRLQPSGKIVYKVLCGKNEKLYRLVTSFQHSNIQGLPYLSCKEDMNQLYQEADAILTKPGGVTITECIWHGLPIIVYDALPGQEEFNLHYLKDQGIIFHLDNWSQSNNIENDLYSILTNHSMTLKNRLLTFREQLNQSRHVHIANTILNILSHHTNHSSTP